MRLEPESEYENALFRQIRHWKKEVERLRDELAECREFYAVTAWNHYMETCKKLGVSPAEHGHWSSAGAIRKAARKGEEKP